MAVDGSLIFNTKIDDDGFNKGTKGMSAKVVDLKNKISSTEAAIRNLKAEMEKTANTKVKTKVAEGLERDLAKAKQKLDDFYAQADKIGDAKQAELKELGFGDDYLDKALAQDKAWQQVQEKIAQAETQVQRYEKALSQANEAAPLEKDTAEFQKKQQRLNDLSGQLDVYKAKLRETEQTETSAFSVRRHLERTLTALRLFEKGAQKAGSALKSAFSKSAGRLIQNIGSHFRRANSSTNILEKSLKRIKNTLVRMFFFRLVHSPLDAIKDGLGEIAKVSPEVNKNLSALKTESTYLKNSLAALAAPLVNLVTPAFTGFMQMLSGVTEKAGQLVSVLTGQSYTKAVKVQKDYAASLDDSTAAANKNTKALEKNQNALAGFDELNVLNQSEDNSETAAVNPLFEVTDAQGDGLSKALLDSLKNQDFEAVGRLLGDKINSGLQKIRWGNIKSTLKKYAGNIADFLNGFIKQADWKLVGSTIGEGINTAFGFAKAFILRFDWKQGGQAVHDALTSFFGTVNWQDVSDVFTGGINGLADFVSETIGNTDFTNVGLKFGEWLLNSIRNIHWKEIGELFTKLLGGALDFTNGLLLSVNWNDFGKKLADSFNSFFGAGGGGKRLLNGIADTITNFSNGVSDFIIGFFENPNSSDTFAKAVEDFFMSIPWLEIIVKSITGGIAIIDWIIQTATTLVEDFCEGLATAFSNNEDNPELKRALGNLGISIINLLITVIESGLKILVNGIPNLILGAIKLVLSGLAWLAKWVMGEDWYNQAMSSMEDWKFDWTVSLPRVPKLATGTVIPANYGEFLAVLGDNKREAEVVSPVSAMKQAFLEALAEGNFSGGDGEKEINLYIDGDKFFTWLIGKNNRYQKAHGRTAFGGGNL